MHKDEYNLPSTQGKILYVNLHSVVEVKFTEGILPSIDGNLPSTEGKLPSIEGKLTEGNLPSTDGKIPSTAGKLTLC